MSYSAGWGEVGDFNGDGVGAIPEQLEVLTLMSIMY